MLDWVEPRDFLKREEFESHSEQERARYLAEFLAALVPAMDDKVDPQRTLDFVGHYLDLSEWVLTPEEVERLIRTPFWDASWENAERMLEILERALDDPDLAEQERVDIAERREAVGAMVEHKKTLRDLPEP